MENSPDPRARQWFRRRLLAWYRARTDAICPGGRRATLRDPGLGSDAPADAGGPRAAEVSRVARPVSDVRSACGSRPSATSSAPGIRSATTSGRGGCRRSRANRSTTYDGSLPDDEATLRSFKGIGAYTAGAVMSFAFGKRAAILDTNVARVLSACSSAAAMRAATRWKSTALGDLARGPAPPARVRLQSGAHGLRRDGLQRTQPVSARHARPLPVPGARSSPSHGRERRKTQAHRAPLNRAPMATSFRCWRPSIERDGQFLVTRRLKGSRISPATGSFPAASASPARRTRRASRVSLCEELAVRLGRLARSWSSRSTPTRSARCGSISGDARSAGDPQPLARSGNALGHARGNAVAGSSRKPTAT